MKTVLSVICLAAIATVLLLGGGVRAQNELLKQQAQTNADQVRVLGTQGQALEVHAEADLERAKAERIKAEAELARAQAEFAAKQTAVDRQTTDTLKLAVMVAMAFGLGVALIVGLAVLAVALVRAGKPQPQPRIRTLAQPLPYYLGAGQNIECYQMAAKRDVYDEPTRGGW